MKSIRLYLARRRLERLQQDKAQLSEAQARQQLDGLDHAISTTERRITALQCGITDTQLDAASIARSVARRHNITRSAPGGR